MKTKQEILDSKRIIVTDQGDTWIIGQVIAPGWNGLIVIGFHENQGGGRYMEHVSVSPLKHSYTPTWDDMCWIKDLCWNDEEEVHQIHPKKSEYVNVANNCLHLWRPVGGWK